MRLKQIKLVGFKSFVDPTILHLNAQLIGIVGPNGCGKSNIIDAVRWVLGESSAKDLRGESMLDVIFNGSAVRKPIGRAAIELLFDNLEGKLNREYANFTEVSIRREIDRDRQSEYYLNDKKCRKRDITDLFAGTGLLQNGYAIIGQGTVSKIIESKPEDLRAFIEEAADISIYKKRRHDTELRMGHTEENLNRLQDIYQEQTRLLEKLEKQSVVAGKYQKYQAQKQQIETNLLSVKAYRFNQDLEFYNKEIQQLSVNLEKYLSEKSSIISQFEQQKIDHAQKFDDFSEIKEEYYKLNTNIARLEQTLQHKKEQQSKCQEDLNLINIELKKITEQHTKDEETQNEIAANLSLVQQNYLELANKKEYAEKIYLNAQIDMQNLQAMFNDVQLKLHTAQNRTDKTKFSIEQIENLSKELCLRVEKLNQENNNYDQNNLLTDILLLEKKLRAEESLLQDKHKELSIIVEQAQQHKKHIKDLLNNKSELQSEIHKLQGIIGSLEILQQSALEVNADKLNWLKINDIPNDALFFNKLVIEDGWELAVGVILSRYLDAILLPRKLEELSEEVWQSVQDFRLVLIEDRSGILGDQPSLSKDNNDIKDKIPLSSKVQEDLGMGALFAAIYVAEDLTFAIEHRKTLLPNQCFVTKKGELIGLNWLIIDKIDNKQKVLLRNKELKNLLIKLSSLESELLGLNSQVESAELELIDIEKKHADIMDYIKEQSNLIKGLASEVSAKKSKSDSIKARSEKIHLEISEYQNKLTELSTKEKILRASLSKEIEEISDLFEQDKNFAEQKSKLQQTLDPLKESSQLASKEFHNVSLEKQQLITRNQALDEAKHRLTNQMQILKQKQSKLQLELQSHSSPLRPLELELGTLLDNKLLQEGELKSSEAMLSEAENNIRQSENNITQLDHIIEKIRSKLGSLQLEQNAISTRLSDLMESIKDNTSIDITKILSGNINDVVEDLDLDTWQQKLDLIIKSINKLGAVNLAAIEEFNLETERKNYLDAQINDLTTALATLKDAIFKIDAQTRQKFKMTFEQINDNFQQLFPKLFGGGGAYLELSTNDLLSSGVSVFAHPPGKKNSSIYLLSGGEKALTAVALIFAIFQLNPAPFCILDEVDAPLDDANVIRFGELLVSMSPKVQFIFITHNKMTMKIANQLTGVTMKEPGVSRLVSVNIDEAVAMVD